MSVSKAFPCPRWTSHLLGTQAPKWAITAGSENATCREHWAGAGGDGCLEDRLRLKGEGEFPRQLQRGGKGRTTGLDGELKI